MLGEVGAVVASGAAFDGRAVVRSEIVASPVGRVGGHRASRTRVGNDHYFGGGWIQRQPQVVTFLIESGRVEELVVGNIADVVENRLPVGTDPPARSAQSAGRAYGVGGEPRFVVAGKLGIRGQVHAEGVGTRKPAQRSRGLQRRGSEHDVGRLGEVGCHVCEAGEGHLTRSQACTAFTAPAGEDLVGVRCGRKGYDGAVGISRHAGAGAGNLAVRASHLTSAGASLADRQIQHLN